MDPARADLQVLSMKTRNVIAVKLNCQHANQPVRFRLYRHQDTCQPGKMWRFANPDPDAITEPAPWPGYDYAKNGNIDAAIEPPKAGAEGDYFWITQRLPADSEKTFPNGFHYVLMGRVGGGKVTAETVEGVKHLGTPPYAGKEPGSAYQIYPIHAPIREAAGAAATASLAHAGKVDAVLYTTVVTLAESQDPMAEARKQLDAAIERGFDRLVQDERAWFKAQYERRESGRVFVEGFNADEAESLAAFSDWGEIGGTLPCKPDVDRHEAIFGGYESEQDVQPWHGLKPWDELFDTEYFVRNRVDKQERYRKLPRYWLPAGKRQAWDVFRLPGMYLNVGYTPPILPERMWNTCDTYDFCVSLTPALVKLAWDNLNNRVHALLGANPDEIISAWGSSQVTRTKIDSPARLYEAVTYQPERVLNSRSGRMHFFPCVPADASVAFRDFQARGGFLVSAKMKKGVVTSVRITARRDVECKLKNPWPGKPLCVTDVATQAPVPCETDSENPAFCRFQARKGATYVLSSQENGAPTSTGATRC